MMMMMMRTMTQPKRKRERCADCGTLVMPGQEWCSPCRAAHVALGDLIRVPAMTPEQRSDRAIARAEEIVAKEVSLI